MRKIILLYCFCLPFLLQAQTKVSFDGNVETLLDNNITTTTMSLYQVPTGANRLLVVSIGFRQESAGGITSITYNGQNLDQGICTNQVFNGGTVFPYSCIWYLPLGSGETIVSDVEITFAVSVNYAIINASTYQGVDQLNPIGATGFSRALSGISTNINLSTDPSDGVVDNMLSGGISSIVQGPNQTPVSIAENQSVNGSSFEPSLGGTIGMSWTKTPSSYTHVAMVLNSCGACVALPVEWLDFRAESKDDAVHLSWTTQEETNNRGFDIQHSNDGITWQSIGFVEGVNRSLGNYHFVHPQVQAGPQYYRLKQMDWGGTVDFSKVISLDIQSGVTVRVYPNPMVDQLRIDGWIEGTLNLYNQQGQIVLQDQLREEKSIDIQHLPAGNYFLVIETKGKRTTRHLLKL